MEIIPNGMWLTSHSADVGDFKAMPLHELADQFAAGTLRIQIGRFTISTELLKRTA